MMAPPCLPTCATWRARTSWRQRRPLPAGATSCPTATARRVPTSRPGCRWAKAGLVIMGAGGTTAGPVALPAAAATQVWCCKACAAAPPP